MQANGLKTSEPPLDLWRRVIFGPCVESFSPIAAVLLYVCERVCPDGVFDLVCS